MMMTGEYEFKDTFTAWQIRKAQVISDADSTAGYVYPILIQIVFVITLFVVTIVISNLITGLTVDNIKGLYRTANIFKLEKMIRQMKTTTWWKKTICRPVKRLILSCWNIQEEFDEELKHLVCVEPNGKNLIDEHTDMFAYNQEYPVYLFDEDCGEKITKNIPERFISKSVIQNTFKYLKEKDQYLKEIHQLEEGCPL